MSESSIGKRVLEKLRQEFEELRIRLMGPQKDFHHMNTSTEPVVGGSCPCSWCKDMRERLFRIEGLLGSIDTVNFKVLESLKPGEIVHAKLGSPEHGYVPSATDIMEFRKMILDAVDSPLPLIVTAITADVEVIKEEESDA